MAALPYMRLYVGDYVADTLHLSAQQHGAYLLLLMAMWRAGGKLPLKPAKLAQVARLSLSEWEAEKSTLLEFFYTVGGQLRHRRMDREIAAVAEFSQVQADRRRRGGDSEKAPKNSELASTNHIQSQIQTQREGIDPSSENKQPPSETVIHLSDYRTSVHRTASADAQEVQEGLHGADPYIGASGASKTTPGLLESSPDNYSTEEFA